VFHARRVLLVLSAILNPNNKLAEAGNLASVERIIYLQRIWWYLSLCAGREDKLDSTVISIEKSTGE
jgi:hypothetical protein